MNHYDVDLWKEFIQGTLSEKLQNDMQQHLLECDDCMNIYISLIDYEAEKTSEKLLPLDFADNVIESIKNQERETKTRKKKNDFTNLMICYVTAACITVFLMSQGIFDLIFNNTVKTSSKFTNLPLKTTGVIFNGWSDRLTEKTSNFLDDLVK